MKVVILCGGKGTRLSEYTEDIPKPLIEIGGKPIIWHLMKIYEHYGHTDFILCLGYKGEKIKSFFKDSTWNINFVDTGVESNKGERLRKIEEFIDEDNFLVSYGDDLCDVDINKVIDFHKKTGKIATLTAVQLISPFGILELEGNEEIVGFREKPKLDYLMNGGFYVFNKKIFSYIKEGCDLEKDAFEKLAEEKEIAAFSHKGFWKSMNTLKDVMELNELWKGKKPWVVWK
jgi:glucose-1-phosphate cytidylyltransferase|tara:strand:- start:12 stop:704 length:693 start_codon:yes stop_codon:yes gene_type:complete